MEAAGLAIGVVGIAGLFNSCLDSLAKVQSYRSSKADSNVLNTRFRAAKARFEQWGVSVGIVHDKLMQNHHSALDNQDTAVVVEDILRIITKTIIGGVDVQESKNIGAHRHNEPYSTDLSTSRRKRLRWALGGKEERIEQVDMFEKLVQQLYNLVPPNTEVMHGDRLQGKGELEDLRRMLANVEKEIQAEVRRDVYLWLGKSPPSDRYEDSISKRVDNTCDWIFERPTFKSWLMEGNSSKPSVLWINGPAGFGKTILCAHIVQRLSNVWDTPVAYFFFTSDHESRENPYLALRSWISQVAVRHDAAFECLREAWEVDLGQVASRRTLIKIFKALVDTVPGCIFVVDGLDECTHLENGDASAAEFLSDIINTVSESEVKLLSISRDEPGIRNAIMDNTTDHFAEYRIKPGDVRSDTATFSQFIVDRKLSNKNEEIRATISGAMTERCQGQFLWLKMQEQSLRKGMSKKRLQQVVENTPSGLDRLYDHNWAKITDMTPWERDRVFSLLRWTAFAVRPLTIYEITEATLITQFEELDPEELPDTIDDDYVKTEVVGLCGPLIEVKQPPETSLAGHRTVNIPHFSVRQYLLRQLPIPTWLQQNGRLQESYERLQHTILAKACLQYIKLPQVWTDEMSQKVSNRAFLTYAARCWFSHVESGFQDSSILEISTELLSDENPAYNHLAKYLAARLNTEDPDLKRPLTPLEYALNLNWAAMANSLVNVSNVNQIGWTGRPPISFACYAGMAEVMYRFIQVGADLTIVDRFGRTPLHFAAENGSKEAIKILVEQGADLTAQDQDGWTPLHNACLEGNVRACEYLIQRGSSLTTTSNEGSTPLHLASYSGHSEVVRVILENGPENMVTEAHPNIAHPLHFASANGDSETVKALLEYGARTSIFVPGLEGWSPLAIASNLGHTAIVELLLDHGAEAMLTVTNDSGLTPLHIAATSAGDNHELVELLLRRGAEVTMSVADDQGRTPLFLASVMGHFKILKLLLQHQAHDLKSVLRPTKTTLATPLLIASCFGHVEVVKELLTYGAEATIATPDINGMTPLHAASGKGHIEIVKHLLDHGAKETIAIQDADGNTPLYSASFYGLGEVVKVLLEHGAEATITIANKYNMTPLCAASRCGSSETVQHLLNFGAEATIARHTVYGDTPLHAAAEMNYIKVVKLLLDISPTHCSLRDHLGCTPLFLASRFGNLEIVDLLLSADSSDLDSTDWKGSSPIFAAVANGHLEVVKLLISRGANINSGPLIGQGILWWARRTGNPKLIRLLEDQETSIDAPTRDTYTCYEPPVDDANQVIFDASMGWCDVCTLIVEHGQGYNCSECPFSSLLVCSECFDRGHQVCNKFHMLAPK